MEVNKRRRINDLLRQGNIAQAAETILSLPKVIWDSISSYLSIQDIVALCFVNQQFRIWSLTSENLWSMLYQRNYSSVLSLGQIRTMLSQLLPSESFYDIRALTLAYGATETLLTNPVEGMVFVLRAPDHHRVITIDVLPDGTWAFQGFNDVEQDIERVFREIQNTGIVTFYPIVTPGEDMTFLNVSAGPISNMVITIVFYLFITKHGYTLAPADFPSLNIQCSICNAIDNIQKCAECKTLYCSEKCQRKDWVKGHFKSCFI